MKNTVLSKQGVPIRLTDERWAHIEYEHDDLQGMRDEVLRAVSEPDRVFAGGEGELLAVRAAEGGKTLVVIYKEISQSDGFVITAYLTRRARQLQRRTVIWP